LAVIVGEAREEGLLQSFFGLCDGLVVVLAGAIDDDLKLGAIESGGIHGVKVAFEHAEREGAGFGDE
jgi:hypothetical protein